MHMSNNNTSYGNCTLPSRSSIFISNPSIQSDALESADVNSSFKPYNKLEFGCCSPTYLRHKANGCKTNSKKVKKTTKDEAYTGQNANNCLKYQAK